MEKNDRARRPGFSQGRRKDDPRAERKSILDRIAEVDRDILRLLMRRHNFLSSIRQKGRIDPREEKVLREIWQREVGRVSRDPDLSGHFFTLMQQLTFLPKPSEDENAAEQTGAQRRVAFNLAPAQKPVRARMVCPLADWSTFAWLYMAAAAGQPVRLEPCLQNDPQIDFIKSLVQMGAAVSREDKAIVTRQFEPIGAPDRVLNVGGSEFAFYLFLAHYLGRPSRVKFVGAANLKLADFSALRHFLPQTHARLITLIPKMDGLPARMESAGLLPPGVSIGPDLSPLFAEALILAAPFYSSPFMIDLAPHPAREAILAHVLPIMRDCGVVFSLDNSSIAIEPSDLVMPGHPCLPLEPELAAFLLAIAAPLSGEITLEGAWPQWPELEPVWTVCAGAGWKRDKAAVSAGSQMPLREFNCAWQPESPRWSVPLQTALAACAVLKGGSAHLPSQWLDNGDVADFLRIAGLNVESGGKLSQGEPYAGPGWNAPSPAWALALAVTACARPGRSGWPLGNPAEVMELWPLFWTFYNSLPEPVIKKAPVPSEEKKPARRRIHTSVAAVLPEINEED